MVARQCSSSSRSRNSSRTRGNCCWNPSPSISQLPTTDFQERLETILAVGVWKLEISFFHHVGILVIPGRRERFLDGSRTHPTQQIDLGTSFVVCPRRPSTSERLLSDDSAGRLVVDVEVASGVSQQLAGLHDGRPLGGKDRTGQCVRR